MAVWTIEPKEGVTDLGNGKFHFDGNESANPSSYTITYTDDNGATGSTTFVIPPCDPCYFIVNTNADTVNFMHPQTGDVLKTATVTNGKAEFTSNDNSTLRLAEIKAIGVKSGYEYQEIVIPCNGTVELNGKEIKYTITADPKTLGCSGGDVQFDKTRENN